MGYVYRYMRGCEWIYVGKASKSVTDRVEAHKREERFSPYLKDCVISYCEFQNNGDMDAAEVALIKIFKPILNIKDKTDTFFPFSVDADRLKWKSYSKNCEKRSGTLFHVKKADKVPINLAELCVDMPFAYRNADKIKEWYLSYYLLSRSLSMQQVFESIMRLSKQEFPKRRGPGGYLYTGCPFPDYVEEEYFAARMENAKVLWKKDNSLKIFIDYRFMWDMDYIKRELEYFNEEVDKDKTRELRLRMGIGDYDAGYLFDCYSAISKSPPAIAGPKARFAL